MSGDGIADLQKRLGALKSEIAKTLEDKKNGTFNASHKGNAGVPKLRKTLKGHFGKIYAMHWAGKESDMLVSASQDGKLIIWNGNTTNKLQAIPLRSAWVMTCGFEQTRNRLVACGGLDNVCTIYQVNTESATNNRPVAELAAHDGYLPCTRFRGGGNILTASGDSTCIYWDIQTGAAVKQFHDHSGDVMFLDVNPHNENLFVSASVDLTCKLWDIRTGQCAMTFHGHESDVNSVAFFPDGNAFGTGSDDSTSRLFDLRCYQEVNVFTNDRILCGITSVAFSQSGRLMFCGYDDCNAFAWDTIYSTGDSTDYAFQLGTHGNRVSCLGVQSQGKALCTGSWDTHLRVWA